MRKLRLLLIAASALALVACGSGEDNTLTGDSSNTGGTGGTNTTDPNTQATSSITAVSSSSTLPSDGSSSVTITAYVRDTDNRLIAGIPVEFTSTSGGISGSPAITDSTGAATGTLITAGDDTLRTITVTAKAGDMQSTVDVQVAAASTSSDVQMGNGTDANFLPGTIGISNADVSAGGSTSLTVSLVQPGGILYTGSASIGFNSPCIAANTAEVSQNGAPVASVSTTTGIATVTYVAAGCSGNDIITATTAIGDQSLSATGTVTVATAEVGSIEFLSATPTNIALKGVSAPGHPETSTVVFRVKDKSNGPVSGATVTFDLNTHLGGVKLSSPSATSDAQGNVQAIVNSGTVATPVRVTASTIAGGRTISTQSSLLTVTTGIPTAASFSLAVQCFNIEGWSHDGVTTSVTARLGDRFQNPVPDGTAITFSAEGGNIQSQCTTETTTTEGGLCSVNYRSSNPRPTNGRVTLFAKAIGEESFTDTNSNGVFDDRDTNSDGSPDSPELFADQSEPFRDDDEDGTYDPGEPFYDFNVNFSRDPADGNFNGALCESTNGVCSGSSTTGIAGQNVIILSGSTPNVTDPAGAAVPASVVMPVGSAKSFSFWVRDVNENVMPAGTKVSLSGSGGGVTVTQPNEFVVPCTPIATGAKVSGITVFNFSATRDTTGGTGILTLTVKTPKGIVTTTQISVPTS